MDLRGFNKKNENKFTKKYKFKENVQKKKNRIYLFIFLIFFFRFPFHKINCETANYRKIQYRE